MDFCQEEPTEDVSEGGVKVCKWRNCGKTFTEREDLIKHIKSNHEEYKKGCEEYPCLWEVTIHDSH